MLVLRHLHFSALKTLAYPLNAERWGQTSCTYTLTCSRAVIACISIHTMKKIREKVRSVFRPRHKRDEKSLEEPGLGAVLPPELFPNILKWVSRDDDRNETLRRLQRQRGLDDQQFIRQYVMAGPAYTLRSCSLVCLYWANQCREYMFRGATLSVWTLERAQSFRKYSVEGSPRLARVCTLIRGIEVIMICHKTPRSYLDLVFLPQTRDKLVQLKISGPFPKGLPPVKSDTPHWSLTNLAILPPSVTAYREIVVKDFHFPSFRHVVSFLKHFDASTTHELANITWDGKTPNDLSQFFKPPTRHRQTIQVNVDQCTDNVTLCLQVAAMFSDCPLRRLASQDYVLATQVINIVCDIYRKVPRTLKTENSSPLKCHFRGSCPKGARKFEFTFTVLSVPRNYVSTSLQFFVESRSSPTSSIESGRTPPIRSRIYAVGVYLGSSNYVTDYTSLLVGDLDLLKKSIQQHSSLRCAVFSFSSYALLCALTTRFSTLLKPAGVQTHVFMCLPSKEHPFSEGERGGDSHNQWIEIDDSLRDTGRRWANTEHLLRDGIESPARTSSPSGSR
ncbi:hypothetical protein BDY19DRAFT_7744 [Irpex rosettiformis]|uniref:Uncharacterized protein n=1 Tax=Irpex rosettiformis TaxID=378272 RepID=A0ACB8UKF1_9APHY|nr:hypothetical protein BDY19DRAFT_7744 [Irpex rosettiformis]